MQELTSEHPLCQNCGRSVPARFNKCPFCGDNLLQQGAQSGIHALSALAFFVFGVPAIVAGICGIVVSTNYGQGMPYGALALLIGAILYGALFKTRRPTRS